MSVKVKKLVYPIIAFAVAISIWALAVEFNTSQIDFPSPVEVISLFWQMIVGKVGNYYNLFGHVLFSLSRVLVGFSLAAVLGITLGLCCLI